MPDDPLLHREIEFLARFEIEDEEARFVSSLRFTRVGHRIAMVALEEAGLDPSHPALVGG